MKAIVLHKTGGAENLEFTEIDTPQIHPNEVLIRNKAISVNPVDYKVRTHEGALNMIYGENRPAILGWDIAGEVTEIGSEVSKFKVGDRVFGMVNFLGNGNAYAEYVKAPQDHLAIIPEDISFESAAASTLAALTALQVLEGHVEKGNKVLIHAGSGGVGHFAIQIAKYLGAYIVSTSSTKNKELILSLGADQHIDYRTEKFEEVLSDIDFVFDMFNGETLHKSVGIAKDGGMVVSIPSPDFAIETIELAKQRNVNLAFHMVQSSEKDIDTIRELLQFGVLKPHISKTYDFHEMQQAHKALESGRTIGKIVVTLK